MPDLIIDNPSSPTSSLSTLKREVKDIGGDYLKIIETQTATWETSYRVASYPGGHLVVWRIGDDGGEEMVHSDVPPPPDAPKPPCDPALAHEIARWQAIQAGALPTDASDQPPDLRPPPLFRHESQQ